MIETDEKRGATLGAELGIISKPTIEELKAMKARQDDREKEQREIRKAEEERIKLAARFNMCPECGQPLVEAEPIELLLKPRRRLFGLMKPKTHRKLIFKNVCSADENHFVHKETKSATQWVTKDTTIYEYHSSGGMY